MAHVHLFSSYPKLSETGLKKLLLHDGIVLDIEKKSPPPPPSPSSTPISSSLSISGISPDDMVDLSRVDISEGGWSLYRRGQSCDYLTFLLSGSAKIHSGIDEFIINISDGSILGDRSFYLVKQWLIKKKALSMINHLRAHPIAVSLPPFIPDFSAALTSSARILRISRRGYLTHLRNEGFDSHF